MWIKSTTSKAYTINGVIIPGNNEKGYLSVTEAVWNEMKKNIVIGALVKQGQILVTDKEPIGSSSQVPSADYAQLKAQNTQMTTELEAVKKELEATKKRVKDGEGVPQAQYDELKAEAEKALSDKDAELEELKAELEALKAKRNKKSGE